MTRTQLAWKPVSADEQALIEEIVRGARASLHAAGFASRDPRFPFVMHHQHYRGRLRVRGLRPRHADVAFLLGEWARTGDFPSSYAWQAVAGAVASMKLAEGKALPGDVVAGMEHFARPGSFETWAKEHADAARAD